MQAMKRGLMGEINVVPYIDVMLVLLVIFMVTAPLLTQGVAVDLPDADATPIAGDGEEKVVASVDPQGQLYLTIGADPDNALTNQQFLTIASAYFRTNPGRNILVKGDAGVDYRAVMRAMVLLQKAGATSVGLLTDPGASDFVATETNN